MLSYLQTSGVYNDSCTLVFQLEGVKYFKNGCVFRTTDELRNISHAFDLSEEDVDTCQKLFDMVTKDVTFEDIKHFNNELEENIVELDFGFLTTEQRLTLARANTSWLSTITEFKYSRSEIDDIASIYREVTNNNLPINQTNLLLVKSILSKYVSKPSTYGIEFSRKESIKELVCEGTFFQPLTLNEKRKLGGFYDGPKEGQRFLFARTDEPQNFLSLDNLTKEELIIALFSTEIKYSFESNILDKVKHIVPEEFINLYLALNPRFINEENYCDHWHRTPCIYNLDGKYLPDDLTPKEVGFILGTGFDFHTHQIFDKYHKTIDELTKRKFFKELFKFGFERLVYLQDKFIHIDDPIYIEEFKIALKTYPVDQHLLTSDTFYKTYINVLKEGETNE